LEEIFSFLDEIFLYFHERTETQNFQRILELFLEWSLQEIRAKIFQNNEIKLKSSKVQYLEVFLQVSPLEREKREKKNVQD
jgi:hypothetical protein